MPTPTLIDYRLIVDSFTQDQAAKLNHDYRAQAIQAAVAEHSRVKPTLRRQTFLGTGTAHLSVPTGFVSDFSAVTRIEFPVDDVPPTYLAPESWLLTATPTGTTLSRITFLSTIPGTTENVRVEWTVPHVVTDATSTIPDGDYYAVGMLAASYACLELSGYYAQSGDPLIQVDSADWRTKSMDYRNLAKDLRARYESFFGISADGGANGAGVKAASTFGTVESSYQWGGPYLNHPPAWRRRH